MCIYESVLAGGPALLVQALALLAIAGSIAFWAWLYQRERVGLRKHLLPLALWTLFGTLDILITAKGTYGNPEREANPLAEFIFIHADPWGPPVASVLWIGLWAGAVLLLNMRRVPQADFLSRAVFYGLAFGHLGGFSSWYMPLCGAIGFAPLEPHAIVLAGTALAGAHALFGKIFNRGSRD